MKNLDSLKPVRCLIMKPVFEDLKSSFFNEASHLVNCKKIYYEKYVEIFEISSELMCGLYMQM